MSHNPLSILVAHKNLRNYAPHLAIKKPAKTGLWGNFLKGAGYLVVGLANRDSLP